jgi:uncharacterized protein (TIGR02145 family)
MSENLNCDVVGSKCYDNDPANCDKYGRLYDWATAMNLPSSCNGSNCASQVSSKHRGICPEGWHIPSDEEWTTLTNYVGSSAGTKLKATSGWIYDGNGEDIYGFAALPGGDGYSGGNFSSAGSYGYWWSSSENDANNAYNRVVIYGYEHVYRNGNYKAGLISVRCLQDYELPSSSSIASSSSSSVPSSSSAVPSSSSEAPCVDGTVVIGTQTWRKCNLNVMHNSGNGDSKCHGNQESNCAKYGRLYNWAAAMDLPSSCNSSFCASQIQSPHRGLCPEGFHIPTNAEWNALYRFVDGTSGTSSPYDSPTAGRYLKSKEGWNSCGPAGSGKSYLCEDAYGFSALPGGSRYSGGDFNDVGYYGYWWSAAEREDDESYAYTRNMGYNYDNEYWGYGDKSFLFSVRCLQDSAP